MQEIPAMTQAFLVDNLARMTTIHDRIKTLREKLGLSMEQLAARVPVSWQTIQQWENGKTAPKRARLEAVAKALETTPEYLAIGPGAESEPHANLGLQSATPPWPFPSIPEKEVRALPPAQLSKLEGALALAIAQLKLDVSVAPVPGSQSGTRGSVVSMDDVEDPFPMRLEEPASWEAGGVTTKQMEREGLVRFSTDAEVLVNVDAGEPYAANDKFEKVPKLADVRLAAGDGIEVDSEAQTGVIQFRSSFLRSVGADRGNARVVYAKGDSMEPVIKDGSALLLVPNEGLTLRDIAPGGVYAINYDGKMIVKVVAKDRLTGSWVARSFNTRYADVSLETEVSVRVLGRVVWVGSRLDR